MLSPNKNSGNNIPFKSLEFKVLYWNKWVLKLLNSSKSSLNNATNQGYCPYLKIKCP